MATTRSLEARISAVSTLEETLEGISDAAENVASSFQILEGSASDAGEAMDDAEDDAESLSESLNDITESASAAIGALEGVESQVDEAGDEASESAAEFSALSASMASVDGMSLTMPDGGSVSRKIETESDGLPSMGTVDRTVDLDVDVDSDGGSFGIPFIGGDRDRSFIPNLPDIDFSRWSRGFGSIGSSASDAASTVGELGSGLAQVLGIARNVGGLSKIASTLGSIGGLGGAVGGVLSIGVIGTVLAGITSLIGSIGGLVTAIGGLGAALAGLLGVGLFKKGEQLAQTSEDIEGAMQGIQAYISGFQDEAREALDPIFSLPTGDFTEGFIQGGLSTLEDYASMVEQLFPDIEGMFDRLGEVWGSEQPEFFAELEETIRAFLPMIEGFLAWFIKSAPDALSTMRTMGTKLIPKLARMFGSLGEFISPLLPSGTALISIIADLVTFFAEILTPVTELLGLGLNPLMMTLAWGMDKLADAAKWVSDGFSDLMDGLYDWIDGIWQAMKEISVLEFGKILWNLTISAFESITNAVVKGIEGMLNFVYKIIRNNVPGAKKAMKGANMAAEKLGKDKPFPSEVSLGRVDFSNRLADVNTGMGGMQTAASAATDPGSDLNPKNQNQNEATPETYIGEMNIDAGENANAGRIKRFVRQAVDEANSEQRQRTSGSN